MESGCIKLDSKVNKAKTLVQFLIRKYMEKIDPKTPIWQLTVEEFLDVAKTLNAEKKYEYGLKGIAKIFGCSLSKASEIKSSGIINEAIIQNGNIIIVETDKALKLFGKHEI